MKWSEATVVSQRHLGGPNYQLALREPALAASARPGQFIELSSCGATLLNKPVSIAGSDRKAGTFTIVYKVVGPGTRAFSGYAQGRQVKLLGPCGTGFSPVTGAALVVGGGIGIPPLHFLVEANPDAQFTVLLGARTKAELVLEHGLAQRCATPPSVATDDGSRGHKGVVTDLLETALGCAAAPVFACGPVPMLVRVANLCAAAKVPCTVCLEAYMGCGMGVCMGCVIPTVRGMERVCREGPVFNAADVDWPALLKE